MNYRFVVTPEMHGVKLMWRWAIQRVERTEFKELIAFGVSRSITLAIIDARLWARHNGELELRELF